MIIDSHELPKIRQEHPNESIVFTGGCFDLLHEGHIARLKFCRELGDISVVGVVSDERVRQRKGPQRPFQSEEGRLHVIDAMRYVDYSFIMPLYNGVSPSLQVVEALKPDYFVEHQDAASRWANDLDLLRAVDTELVVDPGHKLNSTTDIAAKIRSLAV
jgi:D-beta-D-heptose 7-phosphate kinase/D-beta-D-heptose 1-phosphate adenosyltransferase